MLKGYADAYKALQRPQYLKTALACAEFIKTKCWSTDGNLFHSYKSGRATINGYLEDYGLVIESFIALYEVTLDEQFLRDARKLADYCFDHFFDKSAGYFSFMSDVDTALIAKHFEMEDNVIPASNSVMAENLFRLGIYFGNAHYEETARQMVYKLIPLIEFPSAFANWLNVFMHFSKSNKELAVCGPNAAEQTKRLNSLYLPNVVIAGTEKPSSLPFLEGRFNDNETLYYVCQNKTCGLPLTDFNKVLDEIRPVKG
jgi:hypothetical protein